MLMSFRSTCVSATLRHEVVQDPTAGATPLVRILDVRMPCLSISDVQVVTVIEQQLCSTGLTKCYRFQSHRRVMITVVRLHRVGNYLEQLSNIYHYSKNYTIRNMIHTMRFKYIAICRLVFIE